MRTNGQKKVRMCESNSCVSVCEQKQTKGSFRTSERMEVAKRGSTIRNERTLKKEM